MIRISSTHSRKGQSIVAKRKGHIWNISTQNWQSVKQTTDISEMYIFHIKAASCSNNLPISNTNFRILTVFDLKFIWSQYNLVCVMTRQWRGRQRNCVSASGCNKRFILPVKGPDRLRFLVNFLFNEYRRNFSRGQRNLGVNLTSHLHLASKIRMNAAMIPLLHLPLWSAKRNFTLSVMTVYLTALTVIPNHWTIVNNELQIMWRE